MKTKINKYLSIAIIITIANILAKILGFARDILVSYYYGTSAISDAFFLTIAIPTMILGVFTSATDSAIIPQYNRIKDKDGRNAADKNFSNIINILSIIGIAITILILIFPQYCLKIFAPGFSEEQSLYAIRFLRLFSFFGLAHILYCFFTTYSTIYNRVGVRAILSFSTNLIVILALIIKPDENMMTITIAYLFGELLSCILPILYAKHIKYKHKFEIDIKSKEFKRFLIIFYPIMLAALLNDLNLFVDRFLASQMGEGSISALNYGSKIISIFDSMLVIGLSVVILPVFSRLNIDKKNKEFANYATIIIKLLIIILLPIAIIFLAMSNEIIEFIYMRGSFDANSVNIVSSIFIAYSLQIVLLSIQTIFIKLFHSMENTKTTLHISLIGFFINIVLSILLSKILKLQGVALATTISVFITCILLYIKFKKDVGWDKSEFNLFHLINIGFGNLIVIFIVLSLRRVTNINIINILISSISAYIIYIIYILITMKKTVKNVFIKLKANKDLNV